MELACCWLQHEAAREVSLAPIPALTLTLALALTLTLTLTLTLALTRYRRGGAGAGRHGFPTDPTDRAEAGEPQLCL